VCHAAVLFSGGGEYNLKAGIQAGMMQVSKWPITKTIGELRLAREPYSYASKQL
jgi:hypothetical protein